MYLQIYCNNHWLLPPSIQWSQENGGGQFTAVPGEISLFRSLTKLDLSNNKGLTGGCKCGFGYWCELVERDSCAAVAIHEYSISFVH